MRRARTRCASSTSPTALGPSLLTGDQLAAIDVLAARDDDLTAALDWCEAAGEQDAAVALTAALGWYWYVRGGLVGGATATRGGAGAAESRPGRPQRQPRLARALRARHRRRRRGRPRRGSRAARLRTRGRRRGAPGACRRAADPGPRHGRRHRRPSPSRWTRRSGSSPARTNRSGAGCATTSRRSPRSSAGRIEEAEPLIADAVAQLPSLGRAMVAVQRPVARRHSPRDPWPARRGRDVVRRVARPRGSAPVPGRRGAARVRLASVAEARGDADTAALMCAQCIDARPRARRRHAAEHDPRRARPSRARTWRARRSGRVDRRGAPVRRRSANVTCSSSQPTNEASRSPWRGVVTKPWRSTGRCSGCRCQASDVRFVATALEGVAGCLPDTDAARVGDAAGRRRGHPRCTRAREPAPIARTLTQ